MKQQYVSVHGGHSGQFCNHASNTLEEVIQQYISKGFSWVGITEHSPVPRTELLYPDELESGMTAETRLAHFASYIEECRRLQHKYRDTIRIFAGMEIETCVGYADYIPELLRTFKPDYIVGSLHHVDDYGFDYNPEQYRQTAEQYGGVDELYCRYFDLQNEMLQALKPAVVGHFDLIRIFDTDYHTRLRKPEIWQRVLRNLQTVKELDLILDLNLRALAKGATEPYISRPILHEACTLGISVLPGDDSHGVASVANHLEKGIALLQEVGFSTTDWAQPRLLNEQ